MNFVNVKEDIYEYILFILQYLCVIENFELLVSPNSRNAYETMLLYIIFCITYLFGKWKKAIASADTRA